jgi:hypothetical protein
MHPPERRALHIAEAIQRREAEGRSWTYEEFGIANKPAMRELVDAHLLVFDDPNP